MCNAPQGKRLTSNVIFHVNPMSYLQWKMSSSMFHNGGSRSHLFSDTVVYVFSPLCSIDKLCFSCTCMSHFFPCHDISHILGLRRSPHERCRCRRRSDGRRRHPAERHARRHPATAGDAGRRGSDGRRWHPADADAVRFLYCELGSCSCFMCSLLCFA